MLQETPNRTFINFRKANWEGFREDIYRAEKLFRRAIISAAGRHIPQGRIKKEVPKFPSKAVKLSKKRELQAKNPGHPEISNINVQTNKLFQDHKKTKWKDFVNGLTHKGNSSKLRSTVKALSNNNTRAPTNKALYFDDNKRPHTTIL